VSTGSRLMSDDDDSRTRKMRRLALILAGLAIFLYMSIYLKISYHAF
jgi:hypothetical protein